MSLSRELGVGRRVRFLFNPSMDTVYRVLGRSAAFIHVRPYEPLGIVVAEAMAAGAVPIVHRSGGPWIDIVRMGRYGVGLSTRRRRLSAYAGRWSWPGSSAAGSWRERANSRTRSLGRGCAASSRGLTPSSPRRPHRYLRCKRSRYICWII